MWTSLICLVSFSFSLRSFATAASHPWGSFEQANVNASGTTATDGNQPFMIISGITAVGDMCLAVTNGEAYAENVAVNLMTCAAAVAAGDGREIFSAQPNGQLLNALGKQCVGLLNNDVADGGRLVLMGCDAASKAGDGRSTFEFQGNGQLQLGRDGEYCLSQRGDTIGDVNVAFRAAASASSTSNAMSHGASMAVDGHESSFWASGFIVSNENVELLVDWGQTEIINHVEIIWEFAAKAFSVLMADTHSSFKEVFATNMNMISLTSVPLDSLASKAKVLMKEPHAVHGRLQGQRIYGIKLISFSARRLRTVVDKCVQASKSKDARDKLFLSYVKDVETQASKPLRNEVPMLDSAIASLSATASKLSDVLPLLNACALGTAFGSMRQSYARFMDNQLSMLSLAAHASQRVLGHAMQRDNTEFSQAVIKENGVEFESAAHVLEAARAAILETRAALK